MPQLPVSRLCTQNQLETDAFRDLVRQLGEDPNRRHRKLWEFFFVAESLDACGMLKPGRRGLGFAVGKEPLPSYFASLGCEVVASDMEMEAAKSKGWLQTDQHAGSLADLNERRLCDADEFARRVSYRVIDMNAIPADLTGFDFTWSCCAFEHLGTLRRGMDFVHNMMRCLKPGGVGVHTSELNLSSNGRTKRRGGTVLFRRRDIDALVKRLTADGHEAAVDYTVGDMPLDKHIDQYPYSQDAHLKLRIRGYNVTSIGLVIRKNDDVRPGGE